MAIGDTRLPEGTDSIIGGASVIGDPSDTGGMLESYDTVPTGATNTAATGAASGDALGDTRARIGEKTTELRGQAAEKARDYATQGKDRAVEGLDNVQRLIGEAADTIESKVGAQYGAYIRQAADSMASLSDLIRDKDVDQLLGDARDLVRKSPGLAIGAATALGFVLARIAKAGFDTPATGTASAAASAPSSADTTGTRPAL